MKLENWETTPELNAIYADVRANDLEQCVAELDAFGFTVIPPEKVAPAEFHARLRDAILAVHERRLGTSDVPGERPLSTHWSLLGEDLVFEEAVMNPVVYAMARYLCGASVLLSDAIGLVKRADPMPTHMLHIDQAATPPPLPQYLQLVNITWALTDYTRANGAVAIVPGSHRFGRMPLPYEENFLANDAPVRAAAIEAEAGSLIIWGGTTWHGSFPRTAPGLRVNLILTFCRSYMKQVRDFRSEISEEVLARNSAAFAKLLGMDALYPIDAKRGTDRSKVEAFTGAGRNPWA